MKHSLDEDFLERHNKKQQLESDYNDRRIAELQLSSRPSSPDHASISDIIDDYETSNTVFSASTTRSRRFPSDLKTITCTYPDCNKTFNRPARLTAHLRSHTQDRPFRCTYENCEKSYTEAKHLHQHVVGTHTLDRRYLCPEEDCGKAFTTGTRLRRHAAVHEGAERYKCRDYPPCDLTFRKHNTLERHILTSHKGLKPFVCSEDGCGEDYDTSNALKRHIEREHGALRYWCQDCALKPRDNGEIAQNQAMGFTTKALLEAHIRLEHTGCMFCEDGPSGSHYEVDHHVMMHHVGLSVHDRKKVKCDFRGCNKMFTKRSNMMTHLRSAHEAVRYICGRDGISLLTDPRPGPIAESGCGEAFVSKASLESHYKHVHSGMARLRAPQRDAEDVTMSDCLDSISGLADEQRRQVVCTVMGCTEKFVRYADMQRHTVMRHGMAPLAAKRTISAAETADADFLFSSEINEQAVDSSQRDQWELLGDPTFDGPAAADGWLQDEAEMRELIDFDAHVDPDLTA